MPKSYIHILFDLDHTLWDFEKNSAEMLKELFEAYDLGELLNTTSKHFIEEYQVINQQMWLRYNKGKITKDDMRHIRFDSLLRKFGLRDPDLALKINDDYIENCPTKGHVVDGAEEVLKHLRGDYCIHVISNGFEETTTKKIKNSIIGDYIDHFITSEGAKSIKPDKEIFLQLLKKISGRNTDCIMIGDNYATDIVGAKRMNMDHVLYNSTGWKHDYRVQHEISKLNDLLTLL